METRSLGTPSQSATTRVANLTIGTPLLGKLQIADTLVNGSATYQSAYGQLVGFVGTETRQARIDSDAGKVLVTQTQAIRDEVSGVNLDEEATDLVRFQQAYNATAQVIAVARSLIDTLLKATS